MNATEERTSQSILLEDKGKALSYPADMQDMDIAFHVGVNEYGKSPRNAMLEAIAINPIVSKGLDFATSVFTPKEWEDLGNKATTAIMAVPKLEAGLINKFNKTITFQNTAGEDQEIAESSMVIGEQILKSIARTYEPIRPLVAGAINKQPAGEIAKEITRSIFKPEDTKSIISQTIPFQEAEQGAWPHLIPRAIGEAIESVLVYSNIAKNIPELLNNYQVSKVRTGLTELSETLKNKLVNQGYSEEEAVKILLDPGTQNFIRQTPVFKGITGQGIVKMYTGGIEFKPGDIIQLGKETAKVLRIEGEQIVLNIGGKEVLKAITDVQKEMAPIDITKGKGFDWQKRGFVSSIQEEMPQLKVSGQYIPRSTDKLAIKAKNFIKDDIVAAEKMALTGTDDSAIATGAELLKHYSNEAEKVTDLTIKNAYYEKAAELGNDMAKRLTELGRSVQAASILSRLTPEGQIRFAAKTIQKYNEEIQKTGGGILGLKKTIPELTPEQVKDITQNMEFIKSMPEGDSKAMAFRDLQNYITDLVPTPLYNKIVAIWKAGLLTGVKTSGVNILANFNHAFGTEVIKDIPAVAVDSVVSLFTGKRSVAFTAKGLGTGIKSGFNKGIRFLKTGYDKRDILTKLDYKRVSFGKGKFAKGIQKYEETVFNVLGAEDQPFYYGAKARSIAEQAIVQAINKGLKGAERTNFINNLIENPTDEILVYATADAEIAVFQNKTELGKIGRALQNIPGGEFILPFSKTPSAVAMQIINYSPVGILKTIFQKGGKGKFDQRDFSQGIGRGLIGVAVLALGAFLFRKGMVNLDRPKSESEQKMWELEGRSPNTIKIGDKYRQVQILGPAGNLLLIGAQFQNAFDKSGSVSEAVGMGLAGSAKSFTEQTFMKGVNTATSAISEPGRYADAFVGGLISSVVPTLVKDVAVGTDTKARRGENISQRLIERVPLLRQALEPKVDILGQEVMRKENFFEVLADPTRPSTKMQEPVTLEIRRLIDNGFKISTSQVGNKEGYKVLTQKQNTELWQRAGSIAYDKVSALIQLSAYDNAPDDFRAKKIDEIFDKAKLTARVEKVIEITDGLQGEELKNKLSEAKKSGLLNREVFNYYLRLR